jgi:hypothetical protein
VHLVKMRKNGIPAAALAPMLSGIKQLSEDL